MPDSPVLIDPPQLLWRVERENPPLRFSRINAIDAAQDRAGNRFDVLGAGVLYGATTPEGAFAETVAGFRPSATLIAAFTAAGATPLPTLGVVPADWRLSRRLRRFSTEGALPFVDIEAPATHTYLIQQASGLLAARGPSTLDVSQVRGPSRTLTRGLSSWFYSRTDEHGQPLYAGIRYVSRLGDHECWAVFDGTDVALHSSEPITAGHHALHAVATVYGLTIE